MQLLTPASEVILRHATLFHDKNVLFSGELHDDLICQLKTYHSRVHCYYYHHWLRLRNRTLDSGFGLAIENKTVTGCNTLIFYWSKNKYESLFQLQNLLNLLPQGSDIFIVGENHSGVRSVPKLLPEMTVNKIDSARHCSLFYFKLAKLVTFDIASWWQHYFFNNRVIQSLPGVFSRDGLDEGSQLLIETMEKNKMLLKGDVLDMGCGSGVLSVAAHLLNSDITLTLADVSAIALASSQKTLSCNNISARVIASQLFSNITQQFDVIISNPPFHDGKHVDLNIAKQFIMESKAYLRAEGRLLIVANSFLPYYSLLTHTFKQVNIPAKTTKFTVYDAI